MKSFAAAALAFALVAPGAAHAAWTKTYVISWYEPAMYYGGGEDPLKAGSDCPDGVNKEIDWEKVLVDAGYTPQQAKWLRDPANPTRNPVHGQNQMAFRGKDRANVYIYPTTTPEVGLAPVQGTVAEGLDLDHNPATGFTSPTGQKGIDNNYYKAFGCWKNFRAPPRLSSSAVGANDTMKEGSFAVLLVLSGKGDDPMNDKDVTLGVYDSQDKVVKDGNGDVTADYTFRIHPDLKLEAILKGKTENGHILTSSPQAYVHAIGNPGGALELLKAQTDIVMKPNGELEGFLGGYTPWQPMYDAYVRARGPIVEILGWVRLPDLYYALRRYADYSPKPGGEKTHISYNLRVFAKPAFVMQPDSKTPVTQVASYKAVAKPNPPVPQFEFNGHKIVVDGIVIVRGEKPVSLPEEDLLPPKKVASAAAGDAAAR